MTTRADLHHLIDRIDAADLDEAASALLPFTEHERAPLPASLGIGHSGRGDLAERADERLRETGFGL